MEETKPFFSDSEVAAKYESTFNVDKVITIQGIYHGKLSNITPAVAEKLIQLKDNQVKRKNDAPGDAAADF